MGFLTLTLRNEHENMNPCCVPMTFGGPDQGGIWHHLFTGAFPKIRAQNK